MTRLSLLDSTRTGAQQQDLQSRLRRLIVGQAEGIREIATTYQMHEPLGNFLFLGPASSDKTRIVEATAQALMYDSKPVIKIDCSELQHKHQLEKLTVSPRGIVIFEEIEKAPDALRNILLGQVDLSSMMVFLTSSLSVNELCSPTKPHQKFTPGFINSLKRIIVLEPLGLDELRRNGDNHWSLHRGGFVRAIHRNGSTAWPLPYQAAGTVGWGMTRMAA